MDKRTHDKLQRMAEAFDKIDAYLTRLGLQGLQRMTASSLDELQALEQTAHNAALVNIERQLQALRTYVQRYIDADPLFKMKEYTQAINRVWLLNQHTRRRHAQGQTPHELLDVVGELRRSYELLDEPLILQPVGASGWITDTGFTGATVYFYVDGQPDRILQASNTRPRNFFEYTGSDPNPRHRAILYDPVSPNVPFSIYDLSHGAFAFTRAKVSRDGRLSIHKDLIVKKAPYIGARAYEALACERWMELAQRLRGRALNPALSAEPQYVLLQPADMGELVYDEKAQQATANLIDVTGAAVVLQVPMRRENNFTLDNLERILGVAETRHQKHRRPDKRLRPDAFFGVAWIAAGRIRFSPYTCVYDQPVVITERAQQRVNEVHLSLENLKKVKVSAEQSSAQAASMGAGVRRRRAKEESP